MSDELKPISLLVMWLLASRGGEAPLKDLGVRVDYEYRKPLMAKGFLSEERRGNGKLLTLSDSGWYHLSMHMDAPIGSKSAAVAGAVLQNVLAALNRLMNDRDIRLSEVFAPPANAAERPPPAEGASGGEAYAMWSRLDGLWSSLQDADESIGLDKARGAFPEMSRHAFDANLMALQRMRKIVINPHDDPERVTPELRAAALRVGDRDMHFIYRK